MLVIIGGLEGCDNELAVLGVVVVGVEILLELYWSDEPQGGGGGGV